MQIIIMMVYYCKRVKCINEYIVSTQLIMTILIITLLMKRIIIIDQDMNISFILIIITTV